MKKERIFLDTVFVQALLNRRDQYHDQAKALLNRVRTAFEIWLTEALTADEHFKQAGFRALLEETKKNN